MKHQSIKAANLPSCSTLGTSGLIFQAPGEFDLEHQQRIWGMADTVCRWDGVREAVPGMTNLTVLFDYPPASLEEISARLSALWESGVAKTVQGRTLDLPIVYGGEGGPHLQEVAELTGLTVDEVVSVHSAPTYTVYAIGSHPGYCYLGGLDPRLFVPRRSVPLLSLPGGSLSIAGAQTGVSASTGPSGWHTIGSTDISFFDPGRVPPSLLRPGDAIRFHPAKVLS